MRRLVPFAGLLLLAVLVGCALHAEPAPPAVPARVADFTLKDVLTDKPVSLGDFKAKKAVVVVFMGTECPINNAYMPRLAEMARTYADKGVAFLGINSNCNDAPPRIAGHAKKYDLPFPVLRDPANVVADQFGAKRTPEAFLLDGSRNIVYRGRIDDQYGVGYKQGARAATWPRPSTRRWPASRCRSRPPRRPAVSSSALSRRKPTAASPSARTFRASCKRTARSATGPARSRRCRS